MSKLEGELSGEFVGDVELTCVCGKTVNAGTLNGEPCVLHAMPFCELFARLDAVDFLRELRRGIH